MMTDGEILKERFYAAIAKRKGGNKFFNTRQVADFILAFGVSNIAGYSDSIKAIGWSTKRGKGMTIKCNCLSQGQNDRFSCSVNAILSYNEIDETFSFKSDVYDTLLLPMTRKHVPKPNRDSSNMQIINPSRVLKRLRTEANELPFTDASTSTRETYIEQMNSYATSSAAHTNIWTSCPGTVNDNQSVDEDVLSFFASDDSDSLMDVSQSLSDTESDSVSNISSVSKDILDCMAASVSWAGTASVEVSDCVGREVPELVSGESESLNSPTSDVSLLSVQLDRLAITQSIIVPDANICMTNCRITASDPLSLGSAAITPHLDESLTKGVVCVGSAMPTECLSIDNVHSNCNSNTTMNATTSVDIFRSIVSSVDVLACEGSMLLTVEASTLSSEERLRLQTTDDLRLRASKLEAPVVELESKSVGMSACETNASIQVSVTSEEPAELGGVATTPVMTLHGPEFNMNGMTLRPPPRTVHNPHSQGTTLFMSGGTLKGPFLIMGNAPDVESDRTLRNVQGKELRVNYSQLSVDQERTSSCFFVINFSTPIVLQVGLRL